MNKKFHKFIVRMLFKSKFSLLRQDLLNLFHVFKLQKHMTYILKTFSIGLVKLSIINLSPEQIETKCRLSSGKFNSHFAHVSSFIQLDINKSLRRVQNLVPWAAKCSELTAVVTWCRLVSWFKKVEKFWEMKNFQHPFEHCYSVAEPFVRDVVLVLDKVLCPSFTI